MPNGTARYARYNEFGGTDYTITWSDIHRDIGLNGWKAEYHPVDDRWYVWRNDDRHNGHSLMRVTDPG